MSVGAVVTLALLLVAAGAGPGGTTDTGRAQAANGQPTLPSAEATVSAVSVRPVVPVWPAASAGFPTEPAVSGLPDTGVETAVPADPWLGSDKFRHAGVSYAAAAFSFAAARSAAMERDLALLVGAGVAAAAGVGKEVHDRRAGGIFSVRDLVADAIGIAAAFFFLREVR